MAENWKEGMTPKFSVVKNDDVLMYLNRGEVRELHLLLEKIARGRKADGRPEGHSYLIVNVDEPYAKDVAKIMKEHGHWGK